jgi:hypothetical protein
MYNASKYVDKILQPFMCSTPAYIKDSTQLVIQLESTSFTPHCVILVADVKNFFPSMDIPDCINTLRHYLLRNIKQPTELHLALDLINWILHNNYFEFGDTYWQQVKGCAMGTPTAVSIAHLYLAAIEEETFNICASKQSWIPPQLYKRFVDDSIGIFANEISATSFIECFNQRRPSTKFGEYSIGDSGIWLDLHLFKEQRFATSRRLDISLYQKPTNKYLYLPPFSYHSHHIYTSYITSEINRYRLRCTSDDTFINILSKSFTRLLNRGYDTSFLNKIFNNPPSRESLLLKYNPSPNTKHTKQQLAISPIIFKTTYDPLSKSLPLKSCLILPPYIFQDPDAPLIFGNKQPLICFTRSDNLKHMLTSSRYKFATTHQISTINNTPQLKL